MKKLSRNLSENRGYFAFTLLVGIVFSGISVVLPTVSGEMLSAFVADVSRGFGLLPVFLLVGLAQISFSLLDARMGYHFQIRQKRVMRKNAFESFSNKDSAGREQLANFVSFVNNDIPTLVEQYFTGTIDIIKCVCILVFSSASMFYIHWALALTILVISSLIVLAPRIVGKKGGEARAAYSGALGSYNTSLNSFLGGLKVVRSYGYHGRAGEIQEHFNQNVVNKEKLLIRCQLTVQSLTSFLQVAKTVIVLVLGVFLITKGQMEIGGLLAVVQLAEIISAPIEVLAYLIHGRNEVMPLLEQYEKTTDPKSPTDAADAIEGDIHTIAVQGLSYEADGQQILKDVSVTLEAGRNYLIAGESGSGKSTLMRLISQIGDLEYTGKISCNGKDLRRVRKDSYYHKVCPVFQEPYLFHATLEENILLGRSIPEAAYQEVLKKLNLEYLVQRYKGQEITPERLEQMSGGECQRVALARAMVGKPQVYLLDEVTSALDAENSEAIEEMLLRENATIVHICHKSNPDLLSMYHTRLIMNGGRLSVSTF